MNTCRAKYTLCTANDICTHFTVQFLSLDPFLSLFCDEECGAVRAVGEVTPQDTASAGSVAPSAPSGAGTVAGSVVAGTGLLYKYRLPIYNSLGARRGTAGNRCGNNHTHSLLSALSIYGYSTLCGIALLLSSGAWMAHAFANKLAVVTMLFVVACSVLQAVGPLLHRGYVHPYSVLQNYSCEVQPISPTSALFTTTELWSLYYPSDRNVLVQVRTASGGEKNPQDLTAFSQVVFEDKDFEQSEPIVQRHIQRSIAATPVVQGNNITREIGDLKDGQWYMWLVIPAYNAAGHAAVGDYLYKTEELSLPDGRTYKDVYVDLRAWTLCKWSKDLGCAVADQ